MKLTPALCYEAAEIVELAERSTFCCCVIQELTQDGRFHQEGSSSNWFFNTFRPPSNPYIAYFSHGHDENGLHVEHSLEEQKNIRVLALCFAAILCEDPDFIQEEQDAQD